MNSMIVDIGDAGRMQIGDELTRLFALQDMPLGKDKKAILVEELATLGLPLAAIVAGLRSLAKEDIKSLKLSALIDAAHRQMAPEEVVGSNCPNCLRGEVFLKDDQKREYALACTCERGSHAAQVHGLARWNGEATQYRRERWLTFIPRVILAAPKLEEEPS